MRKFNLAVCLLLIGSGLTAKVTLEEAIRRGIRSDLLTKNHRIDREIIDLEKRAAESRRWFDLDLEGIYYYTSNDMRLQIPGQDLGGGLALPGMDMTVGSRHNTDLKLSLRQPLFTGGRITGAIRVHGERTRINREQMRLDALDQAGRIKISYFTLRLLHRRQASITAFIDTLEIHRKKLRRLHREELVRKSDVLETETRIQEQRLLLEDLNEQISLERIAFKTLCGLAAEEVEDGYSERIPSLSTAIAEMKSHHPSLAILRNQRLLLTLEEQILAASYLPQVHGFAELHTAKPVNFFQNEWGVTFQGGLSLSLKLFDRRQEKRDRTVIQHRIEQLTNREADFVRQAEKHLEQLFARKATIERKRILWGRLLESVEEETRLKGRLYEEHQISNFDYLAALSTRNRYLNQMQEMDARMELIKVQIHQVIGKNCFNGEEES